MCLKKMLFFLLHLYLDIRHWIIYNIETSKGTLLYIFRFHIKPLFTHFPVCWLHVNPWPVHPVSMHPWHLPEVISQVGWGSRQFELLVQPRKGYFKGMWVKKISVPAINRISWGFKNPHTCLIWWNLSKVMALPKSRFLR